MSAIILGLLSDQGFLGAFCSTLLMIGAGFALRKKNIVKSEGKTTLNVILMKLAVPCLAFDAFMTDFDADGFRSYLQVMLIAFVMYAVLLLASQLIFHRFGRRRANILGLLFAVGQVTLFAMPILKSIYAADASEAMLACNMLTIAFRIVLYIYAFYSISGVAVTGQSLRENLRKIALNPIMLAMFAGMAVWLVQDYLPHIATSAGSYAFLRVDQVLPPLYAAVETLAHMVNPIAMLLVGMTLGEAAIEAAVHDKLAWGIALLRMLAAPAAVLLAVCLLQSLGWISFGEQTVMTLVIGFGAPVSVMLSSFCIMYRNEDVMASRVCLMSTLLCVISIPVMYVFTKYALTLPFFAG